MTERIEILVVAADQASNVLHGIGSAFGNLGSIVTGIESAFNLLGRAWDTTVGLVTPLINSATDAENAMAELEAVIRSTGGIAGVTAQDAVRLADSLQLVTKFSDETILSGESMLLTFTNIGADIFPQATEAMLNMAEKFGSVDQAAVQLGKALNDPISGVTALRRVGVMLTDEQEAQIKKFMELGDVASAQGVILHELEVEFGGLAQAMGGTFSGQMEIAKNQFDELRETIGMALLPALTKVLEWFTGFFQSPAVQQFITGFADSVRGIADAFANLLTNALSFAQASGDWMSIFRTFEDGSSFLGGFIALFGVSEDTAYRWGNTLNTIIQTVVEKISAFVQTLREQGLAEAIQGLFSGIGGSSDFQTVFQGIVDGLNRFLERTDWTRVGNTIAGILTGVIETVLRGLDVIINRIDWGPFGRSMQAAMGEILEGFFSVLGDYVYLDNWKNFFQRMVDWVKWWFGIGSPSTVFAQFGRDIIQGLINGIQSMLGGVTSVIGGLVNTILAPLQPVLDLLGIEGGGNNGNVGLNPLDPGHIGGRIPITNDPREPLVTGGDGGSGGGTVTNNYYGPAYFIGAGEPGAYYECPQGSSPLVDNSGLVTSGLIGGR